MREIINAGDRQFGRSMGDSIPGDPENPQRLAVSGETLQSLRLIIPPHNDLSFRPRSSPDPSTQPPHTLAVDWLHPIPPLLACRFHDFASGSYPWRWTTPIVLGSFLLMSALLALINVPLSAYELDQEFTYRPNDSLPSLPLSYMVPKILQHPTGGFTPQILTVGDTIRLNNSGFNFTLMEAFDMVNAQPVSSFSYYNNPFSSRCDVTNMTANVKMPSFVSTEVPLAAIDFMVTVGCDMTTSFTMISSATPGLDAPPLQLGTNTAREIFDNFAHDLSALFANLSLGADGLDLDNSTMTALKVMLQNTFQSLYHLVRPELGVVLENQIYASPQMYNDSISGVFFPHGYFPGLVGSTANFSRQLTSNGTLMAEWAATVRNFNRSDRVPVMLYARPAPRLKPLGSAITSVFVSTFAMLSVLWTTFNIIAAAFAVIQYSEAQEMIALPSENEKSLFHPERALYSVPNAIADLHITIEKNQHASQVASERTQRALESGRLAWERTQFALERMRRSLKKHGIVEEPDDGEPMNLEEDASPETQHFLLHRSRGGAPVDAAI
ncbi:hypothetical protein DFH08DRAFT_820386 [Mycena albidolilacea]|uniref:Uncharacterized protein n=1 Tax=Mycena albidolilacea TaxID=1033008 RepID=A0AAD7EED9_9AGAR|nr:hypothetical protein DFH08DRAFT_820386 [Mycena albidolilacea]